MKNFVFISPNYPVNYWQFCARLQENGMNVLGIGDCPYDDLLPELKASLTEYYKVDSLENYDEVFRAAAFFSFKYGHIDWLESNNEYWLEQDARLRTDFHITTGFMEEDMEHVKCKSAMKACYREAGIPTARYYLVQDKPGCMKFIEEVGYPVIVKPDNGVGANDTYKLSSESDVDAFFASRTPNVQFIMEEFITAQVESYDAVIDSRGMPIFETGSVTPRSIMDFVNNAENSLYYFVKELPDDVRKAGRAAVKSFGVKSRFVHFEFFRLTADQHIGKKGDVVALEVNMRPCGGFSPDMMNYANGIDVYKVWADMVAFDKTAEQSTGHYYCAFAGRRDSRSFLYTDEALVRRYEGHILVADRVPGVLAVAMSDRMFIANFETRAEMDAFYDDALKN